MPGSCGERVAFKSPEPDLSNAAELRHIVFSDEKQTPEKTSRRSSGQGCNEKDDTGKSWRHGQRNHDP